MRNINGVLTFGKLVLELAGGQAGLALGDSRQRALVCELMIRPYRRSSWSAERVCVG
jgi:hypothetical protein